MKALHLLSLEISKNEMLPCMSKQLLGMDCPGCGLQRAVALLLQGEIAASFLMYPGLFPMMGLFLFIGADRIFRFPSGQRITAALGILTVFAILLNFALKIIT